MDLSKDEIRSYIKRGSWKWARTYLSVPHEYIIRGSSNNDLSKEEFFNFILTIKHTGVEEWFGKRKNQYLYIDGYKYWTMGDGIDLEVDKTINRQKVFSEFDTLPTIYDISTPQEKKQIAHIIKSSFDSRLYEFGFGSAWLIDELKLSPSEWYGVEPSKKAVNQVRSTRSGFYKRVATQSFEESVEKWKDQEYTILGLFGSASYVMWQYLKLLRESKNSYLLMFYKEGYKPKEFDLMHHFEYTKDGLERFFSRPIIEYKNYYIVSDKDIKIGDLPKEYVQSSLF